MARRLLRWLGIVAPVVSYPLLTHYTNSSAFSSNPGALVTMMFVAGYGVRRWMFPDLQRVHILDAAGAFRDNSACPF